MSDVCDKKEKVEELERIQELVGSANGYGSQEKDVSNRDRVRSVLVSFNGQKYDVNVMKDELLWI